MNKQGFSIIELVIYLGLAAILMLVVGSVSIELIEHRQRASYYREIDLQAHHMIQEITDSIRSATSTITPAQGTSSTILTLSVSDVSRNPVVYTFSSGTIFVSEAGSAAQPLHNNEIIVSNAFFSNLSRTGTPGVISFQFTLSIGQNDPRLSYSRTLYATASLRQ